jgi:hypothetical protein
MNCKLVVTQHFVKHSKFVCDHLSHFSSLHTCGEVRIYCIWTRCVSPKKTFAQFRLKKKHPRSCVSVAKCLSTRGAPRVRFCNEKTTRAAAFPIHICARPPPDDLSCEPLSARERKQCQISYCRRRLFGSHGQLVLINSQIWQQQLRVSFFHPSEQIRSNNNILGHSWLMKPLPCLASNWL